MTVLLIAALFLVFHAAAPGNCSDRVKRVVGGAPLLPGQWPWLVSLHFKKPHPFLNNTKLKHLCGGALIKPKWILTAGHCFDDNEFSGLGDKRNWVVVLGEHNQFRRESREQRIRIKKIIQHQNYSARPLLRDVALVKLRQPAVMTDHIKTISLDKKGKCTRAKSKVSIGGWGQVAYEPKGWGMYLPLWTNLTVVDKKVCIDNFKKVPDGTPDKAYFYPEDSAVLCAGSKSGGRDACLGDSGGPLVCNRGGRWMVTGTVSTGYGCGKKNYPGLYMRVNAYLDWIKHSIRKN